MDWMTTLKQLAPTVASAFLGPLGGVAVAAVGNLLGVSDATQNKIAQVIASGKLTPEQIGDIKKLELNYQENEKERGFKYSELEFKDRDSARKREIETKDGTNKTLAFLIIGAFLAMVAATLLGYAKVESVLAGTLVGYLSAKAEQVLAYYFGSSSGSKAKTDLLAAAGPVK